MTRLCYPLPSGEVVQLWKKLNRIRRRANTFLSLSILTSSSLHVEFREFIPDPFDRTETSCFKLWLFSVEIKGAQNWVNCKVVRVFLMINWSEFRLGQYRDNDHREHAPHCTLFQHIPFISKPFILSFGYFQLFLEFFFFRIRTCAKFNFSVNQLIANFVVTRPQLR